MDLTQDSAYMIASAQHDRAAKQTLPEETIFFGKSEQMLALKSKLRIVASSNLPVLVEGESGTGKELIARLLHQWSPMSGSPFIQVSCAAVPGNFFESEVFGTGNRFHSNHGHIKEPRSLRNGGTLYFDEIGELESTLQAKLLQFLQDGNFAGRGAHSNGAAIRIVCSSDSDLERLVESGSFRRDLFYRINVVKLRLPALRDRIVDLPDLCAYFVHMYNEEFSCSAQPVPPELISALQKCHWLGNIRQLANLMKRYVVLDSEDVLRSEIGEKKPNGFLELYSNAFLSLQDASRQVKKTFERQQILRALEANHWNRRRAAKALNISYRALLYKIKECRLELPASH
jgi:two-component system, NtrC family, response regulator AtoC